LQAQGVEVHAPTRKRLADLAAAALEIRKAHPRLPLIVSAPERLLRKFERRYPPLVDVPIPNATAGLVLAAIPAP
jgi:hypothetical protein